MTTARDEITPNRTARMLSTVFDVSRIPLTGRRRGAYASLRIPCAQESTDNFSMPGYNGYRYCDLTPSRPDQFGNPSLAGEPMIRLERVPAQNGFWHRERLQVVRTFPITPFFVQFSHGMA